MASARHAADQEEPAEKVSACRQSKCVLLLLHVNPVHQFTPRLERQVPLICTSKGNIRKSRDGRNFLVISAYAFCTESALVVNSVEVIVIVNDSCCNNLISHVWDKINFFCFYSVCHP